MTFHRLKPLSKGKWTSEKHQNKRENKRERRLAKWLMKEMRLYRNRIWGKLELFARKWNRLNKWRTKRKSNRKKKKTAIKEKLRTTNYSFQLQKWIIFSSKDYRFPKFYRKFSKIAKSKTKFRAADKWSIRERKKILRVS